MIPCYGMLQSNLIIWRIEVPWSSPPKVVHFLHKATLAKNLLVEHQSQTIGIQYVTHRSDQLDGVDHGFKMSTHDPSQTESGYVRAIPFALDQWLIDIQLLLAKLGPQIGKREFRLLENREAQALVNARGGYLLILHRIRVGLAELVLDQYAFSLVGRLRVCKECTTVFIQISWTVQVRLGPTYGRKESGASPTRERFSASFLAPRVSLVIGRSWHRVLPHFVLKLAWKYPSPDGVM